MRILCILFVYSTIIIHSVFAQENRKIDIAFSAHYVRDFNWNKALHIKFLPITNVNIYSIMPINYGINVQKQVKKTNFSLGLNYLSRNMEFTYKHQHFSYFKHNTLELPLKINRRFRIDENHNLFIGLGYGLNKVLTKTQDSKFVQITFDQFEPYLEHLYIYQPSKLGQIVKSNLCLESKLDNGSRIQFSFEVNFSIFKDILTAQHFKNYNLEVIYNANPIHSYYTMFGINYLPNFKCKKK